MNPHLEIALRLLAEWWSLPRSERDELQGALVVAAESHHQRLYEAPTSFGCWLETICCAAPVPSPFAPTRGEA